MVLGHPPDSREHQKSESLLLHVQAGLSPCPERAEPRPFSLAVTGGVGRTSRDCICTDKRKRGQGEGTGTAGQSGLARQQPRAAGSPADLQQVPAAHTHAVALLRHTGGLCPVFLSLNHSVNLITHLINLWRSTAHILKPPHPSASNKQAAR